MRRLLSWAVLAVPGAAMAQGVNDNAVASARDAFGLAVGNERVGLYTNADVRGFSPVDAGNARIEGIYFAPVAELPIRLASGSKVRVGITAQGYAFPAPTGIVDYDLTVDGRRTQAMVSAERGQFGSFAVNFDGQLRLDERLGAYAGTTIKRQNRHEGGDYKTDIFAAGLAWRPWSGARVAAFYGYSRMFNDETAPSVFPAGDFLPPRYPRRLTISQPWTRRDVKLQTYGALARLPLGDWRVDAGLFRTDRQTPATYIDIFAARPDGTTADRVIVADVANRDRAWSGELRLARTFAAAGLAHRLTVSLRGKRTDRRFGAAQRVSLGASTLFAPDPRPAPAFTFGPDDSDRSDQTTVGLGWSVARGQRFAADLALSRSSYGKTIHFAASPLPVTVRDRPVTGSVTAALNLTDKLAVYGGHVRGFEEVPAAPANAANRGTAPPAIRTAQTDLGLRYAVTRDLSLVAGIFSITKPYYNLDGAAIYRELGQSANRGVEMSLAGSVLPGLSVVLGTVLIDAKITGELVASGVIGPRPVASGKRRSVASADWRLDGGKSPLSFDIAVESLSKRIGNASNRLMVPAREVFDIGLRYRFALGPAKALLRAQVTNLFNDYNWYVTANGAFVYTHSRRFLAELRVDLQ
ncbi:TonB-dependent receptor [Novosphingobium flavum]|uniref:TonB-dependent receptor n=1 Tax=Novosphingobium flavum TaxID=1778672 RepID=A0A7X1FS05_9SPHN|nr:TonB-dependent receptor [Novosphingobium flavum]MBC2665901.1 TonB-dependent receptor [Novosphingobium flavum]